MVRPGARTHRRIAHRAKLVDEQPRVDEAVGDRAGREALVDDGDIRRREGGVSRELSRRDPEEHVIPHRS
jgi:hypothetical protein